MHLIEKLQHKKNIFARLIYAAINKYFSELAYQNEGLKGPSSDPPCSLLFPMKIVLIAFVNSKLVHLSQQDNAASNERQ